VADVYDKEKRSAVMRNIKGKGNKSTELTLIAIFREHGVHGWRRGYPVKGRPDFVFFKQRVAVFVDGCFWHGHDCRNTRPKQNEAFWIAKREKNMARDKAVTEEFERRGWIVLRIWECELKKKNRDALLMKLDVCRLRGDCGRIDT
jgi:DNA mismatch endonuclease (patch repair protein)